MNFKKDVFKNVSRISIIGGSGSGKSTLANILSKKLDIPAVHLDAINYKDNWDRNVVMKIVTLCISLKFQKE